MSRRKFRTKSQPVRSPEFGGPVDEDAITRLRERDERFKKAEAEDRRLYGSPGVQRARKLTAAELCAIELVRQRDAGVTGGEER